LHIMQTADLVLAKEGHSSYVSVGWTP